MSIEFLVSGSCGCGCEIVAGAEEHGRQDDGFYRCPSCLLVTGSEGVRPALECERCGAALVPWDERTCPVCGREPILTWGFAYN